MKALAIIPAYNEEKTIAGVRSFIQRETPDQDIVITMIGSSMIVPRPVARELCSGCNRFACQFRHRRRMETEPICTQQEWLRYEFRWTQMVEHDPEASTKHGANFDWACRLLYRLSFLVKTLMVELGIEETGISFLLG